MQQGRKEHGERQREEMLGRIDVICLELRESKSGYFPSNDKRKRSYPIK